MKTSLPFRLTEVSKPMDYADEQSVVNERLYA